MDDSRYSLRPFRDDDYETLSRIGSRINPDFPVTAVELRQWNQMYREPGLVKLDFFVDDRSSGAGVAYGSLRHAPEMFHPHRYWVEVGVDPGHRHQGIGRAVFDHLESVAQRRSAETLWASVRAEDERSLRFFERTGFTERRRVWMSRLTLEALTTAGHRDGTSAPESGVTFTTLSEEGADRPEVRERIYRLDIEANRDAPRLGTGTDLTFEQYSEIAFRGTRYFPEAVFLARVGEEYVSMSTLHRLPAEPDTLLVGFTGTLPSYRGRHLASELKRRAVEFARARGYRFVRTFNDSDNPRIWAINQRMGFQVQSVWVRGEKRLA